MGLFPKHRDPAVQSIILNIINAHYAKSKMVIDGPRSEERVNMSIPIVVVPIHEDVPKLNQAITAVTREFSTTGVSFSVESPNVPRTAVIILKNENQPVFINAELKHLDPMGGGFFQCGYKLTSMFDDSKYPEIHELGITL